MTIRGWINVDTGDYFPGMNQPCNCCAGWEAVVYRKDAVILANELFESSPTEVSCAVH